MLTAYIQAALDHAKYELLEDDEGFFASIPMLPGAWAHGETLEACRTMLVEVIEDWILVGLWHGDTLPVVDGIDLNRKEPELN